MKKFCPKQTVYFVAYGRAYCWRNRKLQAWRIYLQKWELIAGTAPAPTEMEMNLGKSWVRFSPDDPPEGVQMPCPW